MEFVISFGFHRISGGRSTVLMMKAVGDYITTKDKGNGNDNHDGYDEGLQRTRIGKHRCQ